MTPRFPAVQPTSVGMRDSFVRPILTSQLSKSVESEFKSIRLTSLRHAAGIRDFYFLIACPSVLALVGIASLKSIFRQRITELLGSTLESK